MVSKGDIIVFTDEQTLQDQVEAGEAAVGERCTVERARRFHHRDLGVTWTIVEFTNSDLILVIKEVDGLKDYRIYFQPEDFQPGDRKDLVENGSQWLFQDTSDDLSWNEMVYSEYIDDNNGKFKIKGGSFADEYDGDLFMVTEWTAIEGEHENPELLALELGGSESETGGFINFWQGANVHKTDIEFMNGE